MGTQFEIFEEVDAPPSWRAFPNLAKLDNIAYIRVIRERKPCFTCGNQYRDAMNVICGAGIDHADGLNAEIINIAEGKTTFPPEIEAEIERLMESTRVSFDRHLQSWAETGKPSENREESR